VDLGFAQKTAAGPFRDDTYGWWQLELCDSFLPAGSSLAMRRSAGPIGSLLFYGDLLMSQSRKKRILLILLGFGLIGGVVVHRQVNSSTLAENVALPHDDGGPLLGTNGVLAGRVLVEATDRPILASVMIKNDERDEAKPADIDVSTDETGCFTIPRLEPGKAYKIIARANDNGELISRTMYVKAPNQTLLIRLDKRFTTATTPSPKPFRDGK
jgi:hypothetical protein